MHCRSARLTSESGRFPGHNRRSSDGGGGRGRSWQRWPPVWDCLKQRFVRNSGSREVPSAKAACRDLHVQNTLSKSPPELFHHLNQTLCDRLVSCDWCDMLQYCNIPPSQCSQAFKRSQCAPPARFLGDGRDSQDRESSEERCDCEGGEGGKRCATPATRYALSRLLISRCSLLLSLSLCLSAFLTQSAHVAVYSVLCRIAHSYSVDVVVTADSIVVLHEN